MVACKPTWPCPTFDQLQLLTIVLSLYHSKSDFQFIIWTRIIQNDYENDKKGVAGILYRGAFSDVLAKEISPNYKSFNSSLIFYSPPPLFFVISLSDWLVFHICEDGSEIELKHCASSKTSVKSSRKYFVHWNWLRLPTNPSWLDNSIGRAAV